MPQITCPGCRAKHLVADQERAFRCPSCGTRAMVASLLSPAGAPGAQGERGPSRRTGAEEKEWGVPPGKIACDWCAMFVTLGTMCEVCGSPISRTKEPPPKDTPIDPGPAEPVRVPEILRITVQAAGLGGHDVVVLKSCRRCGKPTDEALCPACESL